MSIFRPVSVRETTRSTSTTITARGSTVAGDTDTEKEKEFRVRIPTQIWSSGRGRRSSYRTGKYCYTQIAGAQKSAEKKKFYRLAALLGKNIRTGVFDIISRMRCLSFTLLRQKNLIPFFRFKLEVSRGSSSGWGALYRLEVRTRNHACRSACNVQLGF